MYNKEVLCQYSAEDKIEAKNEIKEKYIETFTYLIQKLEDNRIPYAVAGGFARDLLLGNTFDPIRLDGTIRDIDIAPLIEQCDKELWKLFCAIVSEAREKFDIEVDHVFFRHVRKRCGKYYLCDRAIEMLVPDGEKIFNPIIIDAQNSPTRSQIKIFPPQTLFHLFCSGMGARLRPKDLTAVYSLAHFVKKHQQPLTEESYKIFHDFIDERWRRYPLSRELSKFRDWEEFSSLGRKFRALRKSNPITQEAVRKIVQMCEWMEAVIIIKPKH